jgi:predicted DNA-binding protein with PD1-like motif
MKILADDDRFLVRFEIGEKLPDALIELARARGWQSAQVTGIGAVKGVTLAYYDLAERKYINHPVDGIVELISLIGNLASLDGNPIWHIHCTVADRNGNLKGGHLNTLEVAVTVECSILTGKKAARRAFDNYTGLNLLDL